MDYLRGIAFSMHMSSAPVIVELFCHWLFRCATLVALLTACEALPLRGALRIAITTCAVAVGIWATSGRLEVTLFGDAQARSMGLTGPGFAWYTAWLQGAAALLLAWYYGARRDSARAVEKLREAESAREEAARLVLESRLEIMRARVDPQWLLHSLAKVQGLYETDPSRAEAALDEVIDQLRLAFQGGEKTA
jgi:hypothetical protein